MSDGRVWKLPPGIVALSDRVSPDMASSKSSAGKAEWLDRMLDAADAIDNTRFNIILVAVFTVFSTLFAFVAAVLIQWVLGWPQDARLLAVVSVIAALTSFTAAVPGVLFSDLIIERLRAARAELADALTEARLASRAKSEFLANTSHEIRTPLNGVLGMAQALRRTGLDEHQMRLVADIDASGSLLISIVNDILDLSKIEAGKVEIVATAASLHDAVRSAVDLFATRAADQQTRISLAIDPVVPAMAVFDPVRVRQCVGNLVSNAVKFTAGGQVSVSVSATATADGMLVAVSVADTGIGMDEATLARLFSAFSQADSSIERRFGGSGLGLAISRNLARLMGGDIVAASTPSKGSVFTLTFRAMRAPDVVSSAPAPDLAAEAAPSGLRILVADDNAINRRVARMLLAPLQPQIETAEDGAQALALLAAQPFDIVLMDVHMPVMDGRAAIRAIRSSSAPWSRVPVIALTADAMSGERERLLAEGMTGYVAKPIHVEELFAEIQRCVNEAGHASPLGASD